MQTATTGRMSTAVKSGVQALESRMPEKRARPVWRRGRRKRVARYLAGGLLYSEGGRWKRPGYTGTSLAAYPTVRPVRGGADRKGPATAPRWPPTLLTRGAKVKIALFSYA